MDIGPGISPNETVSYFQPSFVLVLYCFLNIISFQATQVEKNLALNLNLLNSIDEHKKTMNIYVTKVKKLNRQMNCITLNNKSKVNSNKLIIMLIEIKVRHYLLFLIITNAFLLPTSRTFTPTKLSISLDIL